MENDYLILHPLALFFLAGSASEKRLSFGRHSNKFFFAFGTSIKYKKTINFATNIWVRCIQGFPNKKKSNFFFKSQNEGNNSRAVS